jgi:phage terminase large subunit-like protein
MDPVTQYAHDVVYGGLRKYCCKWEILACKRHLDDLERAGTPEFPWVFDPTRADRIFRHFSGIKRTDKPDEYIALEDWQKFDLGCIFGWVHMEAGRRRFMKAYRRIARGHAKTTDASGVVAYIMCGDAIYPPGQPELAVFTHNPIVNIVAVDKEQAKSTVWGDVWEMVSANEQFSKRLDVKRTYIRHKTRGGGIRLFSKETTNKDGEKPDLVVVEEWHAHKTPDVRNIAASGLGKKPQSLEYIITTAGTDAENKPCYRDDLYYKQVLEGRASADRIFIMIRELDDGDDPHDRSVWCKANPFFRAMGDYAKALYERVCFEHDEAYGSGDPTKIREFLIKRMNLWQAESENKYFAGCMEKFKSLEVPREEFLRLTRGVPGYYGYDLGKTRDLSGVAYVARLDDGRIAVKVHGFMPQNRAIEHEHGDRVPYLDWAKNGYVTLTPGDVCDNRYVERWIYECEREYGWKAIEIDYDGHNATDLAIRLREHYGRDDIVVEIPQTCASLNQATKRFRELVLQGKIVAEYSPLFEWCLSNAIEVQNSNGDIKLSKKHKDDTGRIDPVSAMINALSRLIVAVESDINAIIKERGFAIFC